MSSYFNIELDTTSPIISLQCPNRTIPNNVVEIIVTSNEPLDIYQDIYIIDSVGTRTDLIFAQIEPCKFVGYIDFQSFSVGVSTLYVRLRDSVFNLSNTIEHQIFVGYINQNDNYDAFISCIDTIKNTQYCENSTSVGIEENNVIMEFKECNSETTQIESNTKVEVKEDGTNWRYS